MNQLTNNTSHLTCCFSAEHRLGPNIVAVLLCCLFSSPVILAQNVSQLDNLIFEAVPITASGDEIKLSDNNYLSLSDLGNAAALIASTEGSGETSREQIRDNILSYQSQLDALIIENGPFSPELFQTLIDLGSQYQLIGEHEEAIEIFGRAEFVSRINEGLSNPDQFISIEKSIESHLALEDYATANQKQAYLLFNREQVFGVSSMGALPGLVSMAESNMASYNRILSAPVQPIISFGSSNIGFGGNMFERSRRSHPKAIAFSSLYVAQQNYYQAIATMIDNREFFDPLLWDLEFKFLETLFLQTFRSSILENPNYYLSETRKTTGSLIGQSAARRYTLGYKEGKNVFERLMIYIGNNPDTKAFELADVLMEYGDWNVLFNRGYSARRKYAEAWQLMQEFDVEQTELDNFFRPVMPIHLPRFTAKPNSREKFGIAEDADLPLIGHIDIAFTISKYGRAKRFEILNTEGEITLGIESRLRRFLRNSPFRPRLDSKGNSVADRVTLRYFVKQAEPIS